MKNKDDDYNPLAETLTLDAEAIELILEYQKNPASLHIKAELSKKILELFQEKSS